MEHLICGLDVETELFNTKNGKDIFSVNFLCGSAVRSDGESLYSINPDELVAYANKCDKIFIHNSNFDVGVLERACLTEKLDTSKVRCTKILGWELDENAPLNLSYMASHYLNETKTQSIKDGFTIDVKSRLTREYVEKDALLTLRLGLLLEESIKALGIPHLYESDCIYNEILRKATKEGALIDRKLLAELETDYSGRCDAIAKKYTDIGINLASPAQVGKFLFKDECTEAIIKKFKKIPTGKDDLHKILTTWPEWFRDTKVVDELLEFRAAHKTLTTFIRGLLKSLWSDDCVRSTFNITGTVTGRISSGGASKAYAKNFNGQNITNKDPRIRKSYVAKSGTKIVVVDAKELELRILAHVTEDPELIDVFNKRLDMHKTTASKIFKVSYDDVSKEQRSIAKTTIYLILYGGGSATLGEMLGCTQDVAQGYIDAFYRAYPRVASYFARVSREHSMFGYSQNVFGRYRRGHVNDRELRSAQIQGAGAEAVKQACIGATKALPSSYRLFIQEHDGFVYYVPKEDAGALSNIIAAYEAAAPKLKVPLLFDGGEGMSWGEAKS